MVAGVEPAGTTAVTPPSGRKELRAHHFPNPRSMNRYSALFVALVLAAGCAPATAPAPAPPAARSAPAPRAFPYATLISPIGTTTGPQPTFKWTPVPGASFYWLSITDSTGPAKVDQWVTPFCDASSCFWTITQTLAPGPASWVIWAGPTNSDGEWAAIRAFTVGTSSSTGTRPQLPALLTLAWDMLPPNQPAMAYRLQVDSRPVQEVPTASSCELEARSCSWKVALYDYDVHQVAVWAIDPAGAPGPKATLAVSVGGSEEPTPDPPVNLRLIPLVVPLP